MIKYFLVLLLGLLWPALGLCQYSLFDDHTKYFYVQAGPRIDLVDLKESAGELVQSHTLNTPLLGLSFGVQRNKNLALEAGLRFVQHTENVRFRNIDRIWVVNTAFVTYLPVRTSYRINPLPKWSLSIGAGVTPGLLLNAGLVDEGLVSDGVLDEDGVAVGINFTHTTRLTASSLILNADVFAGIEYRPVRSVGFHAELIYNQGISELWKTELDFNLDNVRVGRGQYSSSGSQMALTIGMRFYR